MDKQVQIYSVDTSDFYNDDEMKIHNRLGIFYRYRSKLKNMKDKKKIDIGTKEKIDRLCLKFNSRIKRYKKILYKLFNENDRIRTLNEMRLSDRKVISIFDSVLTRTLCLQQNSLSTELFVVQTYFFEVLKDIIHNGFVFQGERYVCFTASAGQIRTKKTVFIKEKTLKEHQLSLMCGLSIEKINTHGGVNINKYLAYLALCNSATDNWEQFNIDESIVVDDMETTINCLVDFIDENTYEIERKHMDIAITHTDGCGMMLPKISKKNMMVRLPWVKGLMVPFRFDLFIRENKKQNPAIGKVKDIYGKEYDLIKDNITMIFTKSQFKMYKYYSSWDEYKQYFKEFNCKAAMCNEEEDHIDNAKINYQMLQTLTDFSDTELKKISEQTVRDINKMGTELKTMLKVLGVSDKSESQNYFQQALQLYPELLQDNYSKEVLKQVKKSMIKEAKAGKLKIDGKYVFICPDMYAFAEYLILGVGNPNGLLKDGEVSCKLYKNDDKLDCLRSPHLYREHAIRKNVINKEIGKWFTSKGIYTSCKDPISKILMFDNDGDKVLVCVDKTIVEVAERNMRDIVPLFYNMAVAGKEVVTDESIYNGLNAAYTGGNIGVISNDITKVWNSENVDLDVIKWLCAENNFVIDYAKTLYKPTRPSEKKKTITQYTKSKVPHFFVHAKDKELFEVEKINNSVVNRLESIIPNPRLNFKKMNLEKFDYRLLMNNPDIEIDQHIIDIYERLDGDKWFKFSHKNAKDNYNYIYNTLLNELLKINNNPIFMADVLVHYLFKIKNRKTKTLLWECFGDILYSNLCNNLGKESETIHNTCTSCGSRYEVERQRQSFCIQCIEKEKKEKAKVRKENYRLKLRKQNL